MSEVQVRTHCSRMDHGGCGLIVTLRDGRVERISGDPGCPISHGHICPKAVGMKERIYHPGRLIRPLIRTGNRAEGKWKTASWQEALSVIAERFQEVKARHGPQAILFGQGAPKGPEFFLLIRLANAFGTPNVAGPQNICHMPREISSAVTCGFWPDVDYEHPPRCVVLWGSNPQSTNEEGIISSRLRRALNRGANLIVVDPYPTGMAKRAHMWLRLRPGSDASLAMGIMRVVVDEGLMDEDFIGKWTVGYESLVERLMGISLQEVERDTWVPVAQIRRAARMYATNRPSAIQLGNALEHSRSSHHNCRALICLMALCGNLEVPGGNIKAGYPSTMALREFTLADALPDRWSSCIHAQSGLHKSLVTVPVHMAVQALLSGRPYPVRAVYLQGTNPLLTYPDARAAKEALTNVEFLVVTDIFMTPTAALADVVLPAATHMEFDDIGHYGLPHGFVVARPKVVDPPGEAWPDMRILNELAKRLGLGGVFWEEEGEILDAILRPSGLTFKEFAAEGVLMNPRRYRTYEGNGFKTPSGKVELYSSFLERKGLDPLPAPGEHWGGPSQKFPLILTSAKNPVYFHSANRQIDILRKMAPVPTVEVAPDTARGLGLEEGQWVWLKTHRGRIRMCLKTTEGLDPRVVFTTHAWWFPEAGQTTLFHWDVSNFNVLVDRQGPHDPLTGSLQLRGLPCALEGGASCPTTRE